MASGKLSPRQKMINMMYLVLTALLALNISKDILEALTRLNTSLNQTVETVDKQNADVYAAFVAAAADNPKKAGPWKDKAMTVRDESNDLVQYIEKLKSDLIEVTGGTDEETGLPIGLDKREDVANYLLNQKNATELKKKLESYREGMKQQVADNEALVSNISQQFYTGKMKVGEDGVETDWESANFEHFPLAAVLPFLTDIQAKVRNAESDVISELQRNIGKSDLKFTGVRVMVDEKSSYVVQGDEYEADVFLAAYDETQDPQIIINDSPLAEENIVNGVGKVRLKANSVGEVEWGGVIKLKQIGMDEPKTYEFKRSFTVAPPTAVISPTKMNVLYRGVENPLEIGVPGVDPANIQVSGPGVSGSNGNYVANVSNVKSNTIKIGVSVVETDEDGKKSARSVGEKTFRLKDLPPAEGTLYKRPDGQLSKGLIKNGTVEATYRDFPFDLKLTVSGFEVVIPGFPPERVSGSRMPDNVKTRIDRMKPGETIIIRDIRAKGPKGVRIPRVAPITMDVN